MCMCLFGEMCVCVCVCVCVEGEEAVEREKEMCT